MSLKRFWRNTLSGTAIIILIMLITWVVTAAAASLEVNVAKNTLQPGEEIGVQVRLLADNGEVLKVNRRILVRVNIGGLLELKDLREGIMLKEGKANFTYLAPEKAGEAEIRLLDMETRVSRVVNLKIVEGEIEGSWERQFATLGNIRGNVFVKPATEEYYDTARRLQRVYQGDGIKTMRNSWVDLTLFDGSEITLEPLTEIKIHTLSRLKEDKKVKQSIFELVKGEVLCSANKYLNKGSRFTIETESATAGVRGTYFEVRTDSGGRMEVTVYEGSVKTAQKTTGKVYVVNAGQKMVVPTGDELPEVKEHEVTREERQEQVQQQQQAAGVVQGENGQGPGDNRSDEGQDKQNYGQDNGNGVQNHGPVASNDAITLDEDNAASIYMTSLMSNDSDPDGDAFTFVDYSKPEHGILASAGDGTLRYVPAENYNGTDSFTYTISDPYEWTSTATVRITINPVDDPPVLTLIGSKSIQEDNKLEFTVEATDIDGDLVTLSANLSSLTDNASFNPESGVFSWRPGFDAAGDYNIRFTATDISGKSDSQNVSISVQDLNRFPVASSEKITITKGSSKTIDILDIGSDPDGDELIVTGTSNPKHGKVVIGGNGTAITYTNTPEVGYAKNDSFNCSISDGKGGTVEANVSVAIKVPANKGSINPNPVWNGSVSITPDWGDGGSGQ